MTPFRTDGGTRKLAERKAARRIRAGDLRSWDLQHVFQGWDNLSLTEQLFSAHFWEYILPFDPARRRVFFDQSLVARPLSYLPRHTK